jgi:hypothetical protein
LPIRLATGTRTLSKKVSLISCSPSAGPSSVGIGRMVMPGVFMSISRKLMPFWRISSLEVRTRQNIQSAHCASVVQVFEPLST